MIPLPPSCYIADLTEGMNAFHSAEKQREIKVIFLLGPLLETVLYGVHDSLLHVHVVEPEFLQEPISTYAY